VPGVLQVPQSSDAASGWAHLGIQLTRGADYAHHITANPPGFESPAASLQSDEKVFNWSEVH